MSINKTGARLWFETQAEIDDYDDLMISNIELKSEEYSDPNFTIVASRSKKEILPGNHTSLFNQTVARIEAFSVGKTHLRLGEVGSLGTRSLMINEKYYLYKAYASWVVSYLVLRELPIRNFYARSLVMLWFVTKYLDTYGYPQLDAFVNIPVNIQVNSQYEKERKIFHWFQEVGDSYKVTENGNFQFFIFFRDHSGFLLQFL